MNFSRYENELSRYSFVCRFLISERFQLKLHRCVLCDVILIVKDSYDWKTVHKHSLKKTSQVGFEPTTSGYGILRHAVFAIWLPGQYRQWQKWVRWPWKCRFRHQHHDYTMFRGWYMADSEFKVGHFVFAILRAFHQPDRGRLFSCYTGHISPCKTVKIHTVAISSRSNHKLTGLMFYFSHWKYFTIGGNVILSSTNKCKHTEKPNVKSHPCKSLLPCNMPIVT